MYFMTKAINKNMNVLVVEDDPSLRRILVSIVKKLGFQNIREAENGQKALMTITNTSIGLVLTDLNMPIMDGLQLSKMIRAQAKYDHVPILVITASDTKEVIVKAGKSGVNGYIIKPFKIKQVISKIESAFANCNERLEAKKLKNASS